MHTQTSASMSTNASKALTAAISFCNSSREEDRRGQHAHVQSQGTQIGLQRLLLRQVLSFAKATSLPVAQRVSHKRADRMPVLVQALVTRHPGMVTSYINLLVFASHNNLDLTQAGATRRDKQLSIFGQCTAALVY